MKNQKKKINVRLLVLSVIGYILIGFLIASAAYIMISDAKGESPYIGSYSLVWVKTGSMAPLIPEKSYILVEKAGADDIAVSDVIVFVSDDPAIAGQRNVHRVVDIADDGAGNKLFTTRGDNSETNFVSDAYPARGEALLGRYVMTLPYMSVMGRVLSTTVGLFVVIVLIIAVLMVIYLPEIAKVIKQANSMKTEKQATMEELVRQEVERLKREAEAAKTEENTRNTAENGGFSEEK